MGLLSGCKIENNGYQNLGTFDFWSGNNGFWNSGLFANNSIFDNGYQNFGTFDFWAGNNGFYNDNLDTNESIWEKDYSKERENQVKENFRPYDYNKYGKNAEKISELSPEMQEKTMMLLDYAKSQGMEVTITSGFRTKAQQEYLLKTRPKYAAKRSLHCLGRAIDISIKGKKDSDYRQLGEYAKSIGMRWGGDFKKVAERWHFDIGRA